MRKILFVVAIILAASLAWMVPTAAAESANGGAECRQDLLEDALASSSEGTIGDAVSDGFFGNEPNPTNVDSDLDLGPDEVNANDPGSLAGSVVPSESPGPQVHSGGFTTLGEIQSSVRFLCGN